ncbi:hypothetical protein BDR26DRAFT_865718 [Obelidium mucronatum]|nr:hypothetical protein BDR26DRAFT_865718 [Obelidium mucronatum]
MDNPKARQVILGAAVGIIVETSLSGIMSAVVFQLQNYKQNKSGHHSKNSNEKQSYGHYRLPALMTLFNILCISFSLVSEFSGFSRGSQACRRAMLTTNILSHAFYAIFNAFLILKCFIISGNSKIVSGVIPALLLHRSVWSIMDIIYSQGFWDSEAQICGFIQHPITGLGCSLADIVCDLFCSVLLNSDITRIGEVILQENVFRSLVVTSVNAYALYIFYFADVTSPFIYYFVYLTQNFTYVKCVNLEYYWLRARRLNMVTKTSIPIASHVTDSNATETAGLAIRKSQLSS